MATWRVYFNRRNEAPQVWSVDEGTQATETNVIDWKLHRCNADSHYDPAIKNTDPDHPTAWFTVPHAKLRMEGGVAHFFHDPAWRIPALTTQETPEQREDRMEQEVNDRLDKLP